MFRFIPFVTAALAVSAVTGGAQPGEGGFSIFLEERVALIGESAGIATEALPEISMRADMDAKGLGMVFDCDARNLNPPDLPAPPYTLEISLAPKDSDRRVDLEIPGVREEPAGEPAGQPAEGAAAEPAGENEAKRVDPVSELKITASGVAGFSLDGWEQVTARQQMRQDGIRRVTVWIPAPVLEKSGMSGEVFFQARWRQLTGRNEGGEAEYRPSGGMVLVVPGAMARLLPRPPQPSDVGLILSQLAASGDERCGGRLVRRLLWLGRRDEAMRGALVMALEHADPAIRAAAARVWLEWTQPEIPGLPDLKTKAKTILSTPET